MGEGGVTYCDNVSLWSFDPSVTHSCPLKTFTGNKLMDMQYNKVAKYRPQLTLYEIDSIVFALEYILENNIELPEHIDHTVIAQTHTKMQMFLMKARVGINTPSRYTSRTKEHMQVTHAPTTGQEKLPDLNDPVIIAVNKYETLGGDSHRERIWGILTHEEKKLVSFHKANKRETLTDEMQELVNEYMMEEFTRKMKEGDISGNDL